MGLKENCMKMLKSFLRPRPKTEPPRVQEPSDFDDVRASFHSLVAQADEECERKRERTIELRPNGSH